MGGAGVSQLTLGKRQGTTWTRPGSPTFYFNTDIESEKCITTGIKMASIPLIES